MVHDPAGSELPGDWAGQVARAYQVFGVDSGTSVDEFGIDDFIRGGQRYWTTGKRKAKALRQRRNPKTGEWVDDPGIDLDKIAPVKARAHVGEEVDELDLPEDEIPINWGEGWEVWTPPPPKPDPKNDLLEQAYEAFGKSRKRRDRDSESRLEQAMDHAAYADPGRAVTGEPGGGELAQRVEAKMGDSGGRGDRRTAAMLDEFGANDKPLLLSPEEFDKYKGAGVPIQKTYPKPWEDISYRPRQRPETVQEYEFARGVQGRENGLTAAEVVDRTAEADPERYHIGRGIYGNGTYLGHKDSGDYFAVRKEDYSGIKEDADGEVMRFKLKPGTELIEWSDIPEEVLNLPSEWLAAWVLQQGYHGINGAVNNDNHGGLNILDRSRLVMERDKDKLPGLRAQQRESPVERAMADITQNGKWGSTEPPKPQPQVKPPKMLTGKRAETMLLNAGEKPDVAARLAKESFIFTRDGKHFTTVPKKTRRLEVAVKNALKDRNKARDRLDQLKAMQRQMAAIGQRPTIPFRNALEQAEQAWKDTSRAWVRADMKHSEAVAKYVKTAAGSAPPKADEVQMATEALDQLELSASRIPVWRRTHDAWGKPLGPFRVDLDETLFEDDDPATAGFTHLGGNAMAVRPDRFYQPADDLHANWWMPTGHTTYGPQIIDHELGHMVDDLYSPWGSRTRPDLWEAAKATGLLSHYGSTLIHEGYAEVFAMWMSGQRDHPLVKMYAKAFNWDATGNRPPNPPAKGRPGYVDPPNALEAQVYTEIKNLAASLPEGNALSQIVEEIDKAWQKGDIKEWRSLITQITDMIRAAKRGGR